MNELVALSVIVPVYNVASYLEECLNSIICQTLENIEIIIVNDGSTDNSVCIIDQYAKHDSRIKVLHQYNKGLSSARNRGLDIACGAYIAFIDSDDYIDPEMLLKMYSAALESHCEIVACGFSTVDQYNKATRFIENTEHSFENMLASKLYSVAWNKLYSRELFSKYGIRYPEGLYHEDAATTFKLYYFAKKIIYLPLVLYFWRVRSGSIGNQISLRHIDDFFKIFEITRTFLIDKHCYNQYEVAFLRRCLAYIGQLNTRIKESIHHEDFKRELFGRLYSRLDELGYCSKERLSLLARYDYKVLISIIDLMIGREIVANDLDSIKNELIELKKEFYLEDYSDENSINYIFSQRFNVLDMMAKNIFETHNNIALYGFGTVGKHIASLMHGKLSLIVDKTGHGGYYNGIPIKAPHELLQAEYDILVICVLGRENEIKSYLREQGVGLENVYIFNLINSPKQNSTNFLTKYYQPLVHRIDQQQPIIGLHPLNIQIQTISNCNATCYFCPYHGSWHQQHPGRMSMEMYQKLIDGLKNYKIKKFCPYLENEPLLDQDIFDKISYAVEVLKPEVVEVATNISVLNDKVIEGIRNVLLKTPHELRISFHGVDEQSYHEVMGLDFEKSLNHVKTLVALMQEEPLNLMIRGSGKPRADNPDVKYWFGEAEYYNFWKKELADFKVQPKIDFFTYHDRASQKQLTKKGVNFNVYRDNLKNFYCNRFDQWVHFLYTGEPILCCMDYNRETVFPQGLSENSVAELYESDYFVEMIKKATGMCNSADDFICKRCISPGG